MDRLDQYAEALAVYEEWLARRSHGDAESAERVLERHAGIREILAPMIADATTLGDDASDDASDDAGGDAGGGTERATARSGDTAAEGAGAGRPFLGLPDERQAFGLYRIVRVLGQGGMGAVYLAVDTRLGRRVALKILPPERLYLAVARERFWREAKLASKLDHPNICPVYDVGEVDGVPYMAMRYVEGETLAARIARSPPPQVSLDTTTGDRAAEAGVAPTRARADIDAILAMIELVARALHEAHERGVVHRDIKPPNIMITGDRTPVVLDFGIARDQDSQDRTLTMTGDLPGTPLYMSPEQVAPGGRQLDRTTDVYSLGATLYECLTLRPVADGQTMRELFEAILRQDPVPVTRLNRQVPNDVRIVLEKALDKDRERRYRTALEFAEDLRRVRENEPIRARRAGPVLRVRRWTQRNPLLAAFLLTQLVALMVVGFLYLDGAEGWNNFGLVARSKKLDQLLGELPQRYAGWPDHAGALAEWLGEAESLRAELPRLRAFRDELAARGERIAGGAPRFADDRDRLMFSTLEEAIPKLERFADPERGAIARVGWHHDWALRARAATVEQHAGDWARAIDAIRRSDRYDSLELAPQVDLVPLRENPATGLWEFWHVLSGVTPAVREDGDFAIEPATGLVFVLIPGGPSWMGAQSGDPAELSYDADARPEEWPVHRVPISAFFLSKYEMTQAQWRRLTLGDDPSELKVGWPSRAKPQVFDQNPVERVSWSDCVETLGWYGLELPSEADWEYACRAGTGTPWWTGPTKDTLSGKVNLADETARLQHWTEIDVELNDGYLVHAPVDTLAPNPFGLYHVLGNVWEWCSDEYQPYPDSTRNMIGTEGQRVHRGGAFDMGPRQVRAAYRRQAVPENRTNTLGVRPARRIR